MCDNNNELKFDIFNKYKCKKYNPLEDINRKHYDPQFIDLIDHIFKLSANQGIKIKEKIKEKIVEPEILLNHPEILLDYLKQLILYINDLLKIFVNLYNLEMGISNLVKNTDYNIINQSKFFVEDYFIKQNISEKDKEFFYKNLPEEEIFIPLDYSPYDLSIVDNIKTEQDLLDVGNFFLEDFIRLEKAIKDLLKLSEKLSFILDLKSVTKLILTQIIPKEFVYNDTNIQKGGADPTVQTVYNKLVLLRNLLEGIGNDILGKEIPYSVNLEFNDAMKIINLFQTNLEKMAETKNASGTKKDYDFNLFQSIPEYVGIPAISGKFIQKPIEGQLPGNDLELRKIEDIENTITTKTTDFTNKLTGIDKLNKELYKLNEKIEKYKIDEIGKQTNPTTIIYEYTDKGTKADINRDISSNETEITNKNIEKNTLESEINAIEIEIDKLNDLNTDKIDKLKEYITKLKTIGTKTDIELLDELKKSMFDPITIAGKTNQFDAAAYDKYYNKIKIDTNINKIATEYTDNFFTNITLENIDILEKLIDNLSKEPSKPKNKKHGSRESCCKKPKFLISLLINDECK